MTARPSTWDRAPLTTYPRFPLSPPKGKFNIIPSEIFDVEKDLLLSLIVDCQWLNGIESKPRGQADCDRKRNYDKLVNNLLHPKTFTSRYTNHGRKYEPVALKQYQKYMNSNRRPVKVFKSGLVVGIDAPYLGASPDGKVIDPDWSDPFGLSEVKCTLKLKWWAPLKLSQIVGFTWRKLMVNQSSREITITMLRCRGKWVSLELHGSIL